MSRAKRQSTRSVVSSRNRLAATAVALGVSGGAITVLGARRALRRWERSVLSGEAMTDIPDAREVRVARPDGAELAVFVAGESSREPAATDGTDAEHAGESRAVFVLAHGWTNDSRVWAPVARRLVQRGHRVVVYDHRGHGRSLGAPERFDLEALVEDLWAVLEHTDARDVVLAGHSMGGITAQALATMYPERVRERVKAMVLVATACEKIGNQPLASRFGPTVVAHPRLDRAMRTPALGPLLVRRTVGREACLAHLDSICAMFAATSPEARSGLLKAMTVMDLSSSIRDLDLPVTVVAGERDNLLPPPHSRRIATLVPGARLVEIPDAGHMLPIEVPEQLARLLVEAAGASNDLTRGETETATDGAIGHNGEPPARRRPKPKSQTQGGRRSA